MPGYRTPRGRLWRRHQPAGRRAFANVKPAHCVRPSVPPISHRCAPDWDAWPCAAPWETAANEGDAHARFDQKLVRSQDALLQRDRGALHLLRRGHHLNDVITSRGLEELDL